MWCISLAVWNKGNVLVCLARQGLRGANNPAQFQPLPCPQPPGSPSTLPTFSALWALVPARTEPSLPHAGLNQSPRDWRRKEQDSPPPLMQPSKYFPAHYVISHNSSWRWPAQGLSHTPPRWQSRTSDWLKDFSEEKDVADWMLSGILSTAPMGGVAPPPPAGLGDCHSSGPLVLSPRHVYPRS